MQDDELRAKKTKDQRSKVKERKEILKKGKFKNFNNLH